MSDVHWHQNSTMIADSSQSAKLIPQRLLLFKSKLQKTFDIGRMYSVTTSKKTCMLNGVGGYGGNSYGGYSDGWGQGGGAWGGPAAGAGGWNQGGGGGGGGGYGTEGYGEFVYCLDTIAHDIAYC